MTFIFTWLLKFVSSGVVDKITGYLTTRSNNATDEHKANTKAATDIVVAELNSAVEVRKIQQAFSSRHDWIVDWIGGAFAFHITCVVLDSVFHLAWDVKALPAPMDEWEGQIILALCVAGPTTSIAKHVVSKVWPK